MNSELATHISLLAAPIYAAMLTRKPDGTVFDRAWHDSARAAAIAFAIELWKATLET